MKAPEQTQAEMNLYSEARQAGATTRSFPDFQTLLFGDKNKNGQRVKIRGSQFVRREEKKAPKLTIRVPWTQRPKVGK